MPTTISMPFAKKDSYLDPLEGAGNEVSVIGHSSAAAF
jgi:hypothetical protein